MEACGFSNLNREARYLLAKELAENNDLKQQVCNELEGVSFRDIDKVINEFLSSVKIKDKKSKKEKVVEIIDEPEIYVEEQPKRKLKVQFMLNMDEINNLIEASEAKCESSIPESTPNNYETYSLSEIYVLLEGSKI